MPLFNTLVGVVAIVDAPDKDTAMRTLETRLKAAGFDVYDVTDTTEMPDAFESEDLDG